MKSPSQIAADAIRDEAAYARAAFARLITLPAAEFRAAVENDPRAQTEFMARHVLDHYENNVTSTPAEHGLELIQAARLACNNGDPHMRCRVEKDLANALRYLGSFADAEGALRRAATIAKQSVAIELFLGIVHFGMLALYEDTDRSDEARSHAELAIRAFENNGAFDRAYLVRLYDAAMKCHKGEYVASLVAYQDAARRTRESGSIDDLARNYYNIGHAYSGLSDYAEAKKHFAKAARLLRRPGSLAYRAKALRCVARMEIRMHGEAAIHEMETAKDAFLALGMAGEVCRSSIAVMEEMLAL